MRHLYTLLAISVALLGASSCSSSRNAQSSDDVYYSDGTKKASTSAGSNQGDYYSTAPSDNYVRMKATDPDRWSYFDDYNAYDGYYAPGAYGMYPAMYPSYGMTYGMGFGYGMGYGMGLGYGMGFYDPFLMWDSYYMWNCWYNPYFYNPFYGGAVFVVSKGVVSQPYANLRPLGTTLYRPGVNAKVNGTAAGRFYHTGMAGTTAYNNGLNRSSTRSANTYYRPANNFNSGYRPANNFGSGATHSSFGGGGGFHGGFGGRH